MNELRFRVGDRVFQRANGYGTVEEILDHRHYSVGVRFDNGAKEFFLKTGKYFDYSDGYESPDGYNMQDAKRSPAYLDLSLADSNGHFTAGESVRSAEHGIGRIEYIEPCKCIHVSFLDGYVGIYGMSGVREGGGDYIMKIGGGSDKGNTNDNPASEGINVSAKRDATHPDYYKKGGMECFDAIKASMSAEAWKGFLKGNVMKYIWRYKEKNGLEDLKKALVYLKKLSIEVKNGEN